MIVLFHASYAYVYMYRIMSSISSHTEFVTHSTPWNPTTISNYVHQNKSPLKPRHDGNGGLKEKTKYMKYSNKLCASFVCCFVCHLCVESDRVWGCCFFGERLRFDFQYTPTTNSVIKFTYAKHQFVSIWNSYIFYCRISV